MGRARKGMAEGLVNIVCGLVRADCVHVGVSCACGCVMYMWVCHVILCVCACRE